jgi:hypothetical protein
MKEHLIRVVTAGLVAAACAACAPGGNGDGSEDTDTSAGALEAPVSAALPSGSLQAKVVEIAGDAGLLAAVEGNATAYIHTKDHGIWYFKSGPYLLGIESFVQFDQQLDGWVDFGKGSKVAPRQARIVGHDHRGQGWVIPSLENGGDWPGRLDAVWIVGTDSGVLGMSGAPEAIPLGTEVFGSMQSYGGPLSALYLLADDSPAHDSSRIRGAFPFHAGTVLGGHSAGSSAARKIAGDLGLTHVWLYGTPNYSRNGGAYTTRGQNGMVAEIINNDDDPITDSLSDPFGLVSLAWGTAKCHNYDNWDYRRTSPAQIVCN